MRQGAGRGCGRVRRSNAIQSRISSSEASWAINANFLDATWPSQRQGQHQESLDDIEVVSDNIHTWGVEPASSRSDAFESEKSKEGGVILLTLSLS